MFDWKTLSSFLSSAGIINVRCLLIFSHKLYRCICLKFHFTTSVRFRHVTTFISHFCRYSWLEGDSGIKQNFPWVMLTVNTQAHITESSTKLANLFSNKYLKCVLINERSIQKMCETDERGGGNTEAWRFLKITKNIRLKTLYHGTSNLSSPHYPLLVSSLLIAYLSGKWSLNNKNNTI